MKTKIFSKVVNGMYITYTKHPLLATLSSEPVNKEFIEYFPRIKAKRKACSKYKSWH